MKTRYLLFALLVCAGMAGAQNQLSSKASLKDSAGKQITVNSILTLKDSSTPAKAHIVDTSRATGNLVIEDGKCLYCVKKLNGGQCLLVFLPCILFGVVLLFLLLLMRQGKLKLHDFLTAPVTVKSPNPVTQQRLADGKEVSDPNATITETKLLASSSRLAMVLAGLVAITVSVCASCYYFYIYLKTGKAPDLDGLFNILLSLGIGVVPYGVNKISEAFKNPA